MDEKERRDEVQRAARISANEVLWAAARLKDAAKNDAADEVTVARNRACRAALRHSNYICGG